MPQPTDRDLMVVQERLAELYASLTPAQQEVLDTIMAAGLSFFDDDDTGGFLFSGDPAALEAHMHARITELREAWQDSNPSAEQSTEEHRLRWDLRPLMHWFNRSQPRPA